MSMTQVTVRSTALGPAPLSTTIPRPREAELLPPSSDPVAPQEAPVIQPAPRHVGGLALALDTVLGLGIALGATALGRLPVDVAVAAAACWPLALLAVGHYRHRALGESRTVRARRPLGIGLRASVLVLALSPWLTVVDPVALALMLAALGAAAGIHSLLGVQRHRPRLVLAGRPRDVREAVLELQDLDSHEVVAVCLTSEPGTPFEDLPSYVGLVTSPGVASRHQADALVVLPGARLSPVELRRLHWALAGHGVELCVGTGLLDVTPTRTHVFTTGGLTLVRALPPSLRGPRRWVKAGVERVAAAVGLAILLPALLIVGVLVRLDSPGPVLYQQQRVGRDGRVFTMYKFRSMSVSADSERTDLLCFNEADGVLFKIHQDPRITRLGGWLRRWSIDEVPQLWNVVRGDMALIGPRPALPEEVARYDVDPTRRLVVKPGLTGLWQVSGRSDLSWAESVRLDVRYVENWSLRLDLQILLLTVRAVLGHRGAY